MMRVMRTAAGSMLLATGLAAAAAAPGMPVPGPAGRWLVPIFDARSIAARCPIELQRARASRRAMERQSGAGTILAEWNRLSGAVQDYVHPVYLLANAAPDEATRKAALECVEAFTPLETEMFQSEKLYARVRALRPADAIDRQYRQDLLEAFEDAGIALAPDKRARVKAIREELDKLALRFQANINEDRTTVIVTREEAQGLPESWLKARKRDPEGRFSVTLDYPTLFPFLDYAVDEDARRRVYLAMLRRGGAANVELLDRTLVLRYELAQAYGFPDYATFSLRRTMARTPAAVAQFLGSVKRAVDEGEARELAMLRADKAALLGRAEQDVTLQRWDVSFHQERLRRARFQVDQEAQRAYFPSDRSVAFCLRLAERLYGVTFVARDVPRWAGDVRYFDVFEAGAGGKPGAFVGGIYLDLFPREGKYSHAAAFPLRSVSTLAGRKPVSGLVANLDRRGLNHEELETLLHEFGHVLHGVLSRTRYVDHGGTSVKRDFVEAPSQMFEEWGRREEPLRLFAEVCPECPRLEAAQIEQLRQSERFGSGIRYARQWLYAQYDMRLHSGKPPGALPAWTDLERASRLGTVDGTLLPAGFGHLVGGYGAGYYGYMWSEVLALDMLSGFKGELLDPAVGRRYRQTILAQGGQVRPEVLVEEFLGRKPNADAFYAEITGARD